MDTKEAYFKATKQLFKEEFGKTITRKDYNGMFGMVDRQVIKYFYNNYDYLQLHYSEKIPHKRNGSQYIEEKTIMYLLIALLYIITVFFIMTIRLYTLKLKINNNNKR